MALAKKQIARKTPSKSSKTTAKTGSPNPIKVSRGEENAVVETTPKMIYRNLGRSGLKVSVLALGGW
jgi:hypothetical protein